ncbi:MAG: cytochrome C [Rhodospirillaceae bacterium]|nr:MAG: cytochrome C [Rhodospirillaceae bacterium]
MTTYKAIFSGLALLGLAACSDNFESADATNNAAVADGKILYNEHCASCHGEDLKGEPNWRVANEDGTLPAPPQDDSGHTWHHPDTLLFNYTKGGGASIAPEGFKSNMPGFKDTLSDSDIWATLSYIKSRWSIASQARQARMNKTP